MHLTLIGDPIVVGENAHFLVTDGASVRNVIVTPEALRAMTGNTSVPISRLGHLVDVFARVAEENLLLAAPLDERTWVLAADVKRWLGNEASRWRGRASAPPVPPMPAAGMIGRPAL